MLGRDSTLPTPNEWENVLDPKLDKRSMRTDSKKATGRRCSVCKEIGHTKPRCPLNVQVMCSSTSLPGTCTNFEDTSVATQDLYGGNSSVYVSIL